MNLTQKKIIKNCIKCRKCGDVIESTYTHDFVTCKCGAVSIDGGKDYLKRSAAAPEDYYDLSVVVIGEKE